MGYREHDDDCDKINYEGGLCTCYTPSASTLAYGMGDAIADEIGTAANEAAIEDYDGPEQDY